MNRGASKKQIPISISGLASALLLVACVLPIRVTAARDFSVGIEMPTQIPVTSAVEHALREMGIDYLTYWGSTDPVAPSDRSPETVTNEIAINNEMIALCNRLKLDFSITVFFEPLDAVVRTAAKQPGFQGMVFDELEHIRLLMPQFCPESVRKHMLADPTR